MGKKKVIQENNGSVDEATLDIAWSEIKKKHGDGVASWLKDIPEDDRFEFISSGSISMDSALNGGFVRGRVVEVFGEPASGKSTLAMSTLAQATKMGLVGLYADVELSLDTRLPAAYGVDNNKFILIRDPLSAEEYFDIIEKFMSSGNIGVVVIDSVTALQPEAEAEGEVGDVHVAQLARFVSQEIRRIIRLAYKTNTLVIFVNQTRSKVGGYGDPTTTSAGSALSFYSTHRVKISGGSSKSTRLSNATGVYGHQMSFSVVKSKIGIPWKTGEISLVYGVGYDLVGELVDLSDQLGIAVRKGSWYDLWGKSFQGKEAFKEVLGSDKELYNKLYVEVRGMLGLI